MTSLGGPSRTAWLVVCLLVATARGSRASEHAGQILFGVVPVPGATVTASRGDRRVITISDREGMYRFGELDAGSWTIRVEMLGFATLTKEVTMPASALLRWTLSLLSRDMIAESSRTSIQTSVHTPADTSVHKPVLHPDARSPVVEPHASRTVPASVSSEPTEKRGDAAEAADGFLIDGSVNNAAASPFAQPRAFGNNRPRPRARYNGSLGLLAGTSSWDARPYSFSGTRASSPAYSDVHLVGTLGGPLKIPGLRGRGPTVFAGYQFANDHRVSAASALMPSASQRAGDFSSTRDASGRLVEVIDPETRTPFPGNVIPAERISPQATALLQQYLHPNVESDDRYNYESSLLAATTQHSLQTRFTQSTDPKTVLHGTFDYQRTAADTRTIFGFENGTVMSVVDASGKWSRRVGQRQWLQLRYQFGRSAARTTPYFADRMNVSGDAGIRGNDQEPVNWGPPALVFASGIAGLRDAVPAFTRSQTHGVFGESIWSRGRHTLTTGGDVRRHLLDVHAQQDPRGMFVFTGAITGVDFADFLLGRPAAMSIAFGNADKFLRANRYAAYVSDDWRVSPVLTITAGVRWEYEAPLTERFGRLVNLDIASGFTASGEVLGSDPVGPLTGRRVPASLLRRDWRGWQPRVGLSWRPIAQSSLVVQGGYGIYRNTDVYHSIALNLAQQPPLSKTFTVASTDARPLTLANGFESSPESALNTFAVDPDFRVGYAHNWQMAVRRDLPGSMTGMVTYLGSSGRRLMQQTLPNTYPTGASNPCRACPSGFVYLTSNGRSSRHAAQVQIRRRLRNGLSGTVQYTLAKALDDVAAFVGTNFGAAVIAQDWLNPDAEWGPSNFDQRHMLTMRFEYTLGAGTRTAALFERGIGSWLRGWIIAGDLTTGSGLPLTPVYLTPVRGTGVVGTVRPNVSDRGEERPRGYYANPRAYAAPLPGQWGNAGRNSIAGPAQFQLNASLGRTFRIGARMTLESRLDATNVLNRVTFASIDTVFGSQQFGLPNQAHPMRKLHANLRLRF